MACLIGTAGSRERQPRNFWIAATLQTLASMALWETLEGFAGRKPLPGT
jgi:hypothetical protein